jgi:hypothetical protein
MTLNETIQEVKEALDNTEVPIPYRWGFDEDGYVVQFTDENGNLPNPKEQMREKMK